MYTEESECGTLCNSYDCSNGRAMRENTLKSNLKRGVVQYGCLIHIGNSFSAELMAHQGWDALAIDLQHGLIGFETAITMFQAISTTTCVPLARARWNEPAEIMRLLDAGAYGIICPMISNRDDVERFVRACRYPPQGYRSYGPERGNLYGGPDYAAHANAEIMTLAMIETKAALDNLDDILSVPGLDAVYVGPTDLHYALRGSLAADIADDDYLTTLARIASTAHQRGIIPGIHTSSPAYARKMREIGFRFITIMTDVSLMAGAAQQILTQTNQ